MRMHSDKNCRFVEPAEFVDRATSRERLVRDDDPVADVLCLLDLHTGTRFAVESEKLERFRTRAT
jgi:hypothetical protein